MFDPITSIVRLLRMMPPQTPGKMRLGRRLLRTRLHALPRFVATAGSDVLSVPSLEEPVAFHLLINGVYEPEVREFLRRELAPADVFVDVGASIGYFTLEGSALVGEAGRVFGLEPSTRVFPFLERNVDDRSNVAVLNVAAGQINGTARFFEAPPEKFGMGSFGAQFSDVPTSVEVRRIDDLIDHWKIERVAAMKVDVEGAEIDVFKGSINLLAGDHPPVIVFEFCDWAEQRLTGRTGLSQEFLMGLGFEVFLLADYLRGTPPQPLSKPITSGSAILVGARAADGGGVAANLEH
jgi:FkbM family methyltransferase